MSLVLLNFSYLRKNSCIMHKKAYNFRVKLCKQKVIEKKYRTIKNELRYVTLNGIMIHKIYFGSLHIKVHFT